MLSLYSRGEYHEVIRLAGHKPNIVETDPLEAMVLAASYLEVGEVDSAISLCRCLEPVLGSRLDFRKLLASCLRRIGRLEDAAMIYRSNLAEYPDDLELRKNFANLYIDLGMINDAKAQLFYVLDKSPTDHIAKDCLARIELLQSGESSCSLERNIEAISDAAGDEQPRKSLLLADARTLDPLAMAFSFEEIQEDQRHRDGLRRKRNKAQMPLLPQLEEGEGERELMEAARQALNEKAPQSSLALCRELLVSNTSEIGRIYGLLGDIYLQLGENEAAEVCYLTSVELGYEHISCHVNLVSLACKRGDIRLARRRLATASDHTIGNDIKASLANQIDHHERVSAEPKLHHGGLF